jgi:tetratricopeptide (TPR) repeat protein
MIRFLKETNGDRRTLIFMAERLRELEESSLDDQLAGCQAHLDLGDVAGARQFWESLPSEMREPRLAREQHARILRQEGSVQEAEAELRAALLSDPDDPQCQLRLAVMDVESRFGEIREQALGRLWELAKREDDVALSAIAFMSRVHDIGVLEARDLLQLVESHPSPTEPVRFAVLSALLRLDPLERDALISAQIERYRGQNPVKAVPLLQWLSSEKEFARILQALPRKSAMRAPEVFPFYAQALGELDRWVDLEKVLNGGEVLPVSSARRHLMLAETYSHLEDDLARTRQQLETSFEQGGRGKEVETTLLASQLAEKLGLWDHAAKCYRALSQLTDKAQIPMLTKVYEMASRARDGNSMLEVTEEMATLRPSSTVFRARADYLKLLLGVDMEVTIDRISGEDSHRVVSDEIDPALLRALVRYRMGDLEKMRKVLAEVDAPEELPAGQRAAFVGMLAAGGRVGEAFRLAENISTRVLLEEELRFLRRAL